MPHTSHRKRKPAQHRKHTEVELDDGWTRVQYETRTSSGESETVTRLQAPVDPDATLEGLRHEYTEMHERFTSTECMKTIVNHLARFDMGGKTSNAVCLALGSFTRLYRTRKDSMWQLVAFRAIAQHCQAEGHWKRLYAQEPLFTDLDKEFLESLGFTICNDDEALDKVDGETFLFVPHLEWTTETPYRFKAVNAPLYITSRMDWVIDEAERISAAAPMHLQAWTEAIDSAKAIQKSHSMIKFPDIDYTNGLDMMIYTRNDLFDD